MSKSRMQQLPPHPPLVVPVTVFAHVLPSRLQPLLHRTRRPHQSGFIKSRATLDSILALRLLSELHSQPSSISACDSVDRAALWLALKGSGFPPMLLKLIEDLCTGTSARFGLGQKLSPRFVTFPSVYAKVVSSHLLYFLPLLTSLWSMSARVVEFQSVTHGLRILTMPIDAVLFGFSQKGKNS